jgi:glyceraldehyde 3-phosphate dehydrogenase
MTTRVGINGMGRIGREYVRYAAGTDDLEVVAVNDIADAATLARLLRHDSTFGALGKPVHIGEGCLSSTGARSWCAAHGSLAGKLVYTPNPSCRPM